MNANVFLDRDRKMEILNNSSPPNEACPGCTPADFASDQDPRWCPGCGDYSILAQTKKVLAKLGIARKTRLRLRHRLLQPLPLLHEHLRLSFDPRPGAGDRHGPEARPPRLSVWVVTGDGDALSIGGNHLIHTLRRNLDLKILLFNNRIYGLTKGQYSPTAYGTKTKSSPMGAMDNPLRPVRFAIGCDATFVARSLAATRGTWVGLEAGRRARRHRSRRNLPELPGLQRRGVRLCHGQGPQSDTIV